MGEKLLLAPCEYPMRSKKMYKSTILKADPIAGSGHLRMNHVTSLFQRLLMEYSPESLDPNQLTRRYGRVTWYSNEQGALNQELLHELHAFISGQEPVPEDYQPEGEHKPDLTISDNRVLILLRVERLLHKGTDKEQPDFTIEASTHYTVLNLQKTSAGLIEVCYADSLGDAGRLDPVPRVIKRILQNNGIELSECRKGFLSKKQGVTADCGYYAVYHALEMLGIPLGKTIDVFVQEQRQKLAKEFGLWSAEMFPQHIIGVQTDSTAAPDWQEGKDLNKAESTNKAGLAGISDKKPLIEECLIPQDKLKQGDADVRTQGLQGTIPNENEVNTPFALYPHSTSTWGTDSIFGRVYNAATSLFPLNQNQQQQQQNSVTTIQSIEQSSFHDRAIGIQNNYYTTAAPKASPQDLLKKLETAEHYINGREDLQKMERTQQAARSLKKKESFDEQTASFSNSSQSVVQAHMEVRRVHLYDQSVLAQQQQEEEKKLSNRQKHEEISKGTESPPKQHKLEEGTRPIMIDTQAGEVHLSEQATFQENNFIIEGKKDTHIEISASAGLTQGKPDAQSTLQKINVKIRDAAHSPQSLEQEWSQCIEHLRIIAQEECEQDLYLMQGLNLYVPLDGASFVGAETGSSIEEEVQTFLFSTHDAKIFLLQGNSGAGKSLFGRHLEKILWQNHSAQLPIPLYASLPLLQSRYPKALDGELMQSIFKDKKIPNALIDSMKTYPIVLILDGYDETGSKRNLFKDNYLGKWNAKTLITCRSQYLTGDYLGQFAQISATNQPIRESVVERYLIPFAEVKVKEYIRNFTANPQYNKAGWSKEQYLDQLATIPNWQEITQEPFVLTTLLSILPGFKSIPNQEHQYLTRSMIYDEFIKQWFEKEYLRLGPKYQAYIQSKALTQIDVLDIFHEFAEVLAFKMLEAEQQIASRPEERNRQGRNRTYGVWDALFIGDTEDKKQELRIGLEGSPLKHIGQRQYLFIHKSFYEYFVAQLLLKDLLEKERAERYQHLNQKLLTQEPAIIQFIAEKVNSEEEGYKTLKDRLFQIVQDSKSDPNLRHEKSFAAANAITILSYANISFAGYDFSYTNLAGADLTVAIFDHTDCTGTNLTNALLSQAWIRDSIFKGALLEGIILDEDLLFRDIGWGMLEKKQLAINQNGEIFIAATQENMIEVWHNHSKQKKRLGSTEKIRSLSIDRQGLELLSLNADFQTVSLWDVMYTQKKWSMTAPFKVAALGLNSDSKRFALFGKGIVEIYQYTDQLNLEAAVPVLDMNEEHSHSYLNSSLLLYSPDGTMLAYANKNMMEWLDLMSLNLTKYNVTTDHKISAIQFSQDGTHIVCGTEKGEVVCLNLINQNKFTFHTNTSEITSLAFSPNNEWLIVSHEGLVRIWDIKQQKCVHAMQDMGDIITWNKVNNKLYFRKSEKIISFPSSSLQFLISTKMVHTAPIVEINYDSALDSFTTMSIETQGGRQFQLQRQIYTKSSMCINTRILPWTEGAKTNPSWQCKAALQVLKNHLPDLPALNISTIFKDLRSIYCDKSTPYILTGHADGSSKCWRYDSEAKQLLLQWREPKINGFHLENSNAHMVPEFFVNSIENNFQKLLCWIIADDLERVDAILQYYQLQEEQYFSNFVFHSDNDGNTGLHFAIMAGNASIVQRMLEYGYSQDIPNHDNQKPFDLALRWEPTHSNKVVNKTQSSFALKTSEAIRISYEVSAITIDDINLLRDFILEWQKVVEREETQTFARGHLQNAQLLLEWGAKVDTLNKDSQVALHSAVLARNKEMVALLIENGACLTAKDKDGNAALHLAASVNRPDILELLLKKGAYLQEPGQFGMTALHAAAEHHNTDAIRFLLGNGLEINAKDNEGMTALHYVVERCYSAEDKHIGTITLLLELGADIEVRDIYGRTALHYTIRREREGLMRLLLSHGANINVQDENGMTILHYAIQAKYDNFALVISLLACGIDVNISDISGRKALHYAALYCNLKVVFLLIGSAGAKLSDTSYDAQTPAMVVQPFFDSIYSILEKMEKLPAQLQFAIANYYALLLNIELLESKIIAKETPESQKKDIYQNLGCFYHALSKTIFAMHRKTEYEESLKKAEESFKLSVNDQNVASIHYIGYANFLYMQKRSSEALPYLRKSLASKNEDLLFYSPLNSLCVPPSLQKEIDFLGFICVQPSVFACYLLAEIYMQKKQWQNAVEVCVEFESQVSTQANILGYSLLGYTFEKLGKFQDASNAFGIAMSNYKPSITKPIYSLAKENIERCVIFESGQADTLQSKKIKSALIIQEFWRNYRRHYKSEFHASNIIDSINTFLTEEKEEELLKQLKNVADYQMHSKNRKIQDGLNALDNVTKTLKQRGKHTEAIQYQNQQILMIQKRIELEPDHPDIATSLNRLAVDLHNMGKYEEALPYYKQALEIRERLYREQNHSDLALSLSNLGLVLDAIGKREEALHYFKRALEMRQLCMEQDHPDITASLNNLAGALHNMGKYGEALPYYKHVLEIQERLYKRQDHLEVAQSLNVLAVTAHEIGRYEETLSYNKRALEIRERLYPGKDHKDVAESLHNLGVTLHSMGKYGEARLHYDRAIAIAVALNNSSLQAEYLTWAAITLVALNQLPEALTYLLQAVSLDSSAYNKRLLAQGYALQAQDDSTISTTEHIEYYFKEALITQEEANIHLFYGGFLFLQQRNHEAIECWEKTLLAPQPNKPIFPRHLALGTILPPIQQEIRALGIFRSTPQLLAHFSLVYVYQKQGNQEKAQYHLEQLTSTIEALEPFHTHYSLLGHARLCLGLYQDAAEAFAIGAALYETIFPGKEYTLAEVHREFCLSCLPPRPSKQHAQAEYSAAHENFRALTDILHTKPAKGDSVLHWAVIQQNMYAVRSLLTKNIDIINLQGDKGFTAIHLAAGLGNFDIFKLLLDYGANIRIRDTQGAYCVHFAAGGGDIRVIELLLEKAFDILLCDNDGYTVLHYASRRGQVAAMQRLIGLGASVNAQTNEGQTPLHRAALFGQEEAVLELLSKKANVMICDISGKTASRLAREANFIDLATLLEKFEQMPSKLHENIAKKLLGTTADYKAIQKNIEDNLSWVEQKLPQTSYHNLGCFYHAAAWPILAKYGKEHKEYSEYLQKADSSFVQALQLGITSRICAEYGQFLFMHNRHPEAVAYLMQAIDLQDDKELFYDTLQRMTVDKYLRREIDFHGSMSLLTSMLSCYLLVIVHKRLGNHDECFLVFQTFEEHVSSSLDPLAHSLFGYAAMQYGDHEQGARAFEQASMLYAINNPGKQYTLAKVNQHICLSRIAQLEAKSLDHIQNLNPKTARKEAMEVQRYWREYVIKNQLELEERQLA